MTKELQTGNKINNVIIITTTTNVFCTCAMIYVCERIIYYCIIYATCAARTMGRRKKKVHPITKALRDRLCIANKGPPDLEESKCSSADRPGQNET